MITNNVALGLPIPPYDPYAISVSLPAWRDNVGYEENEARVANSMVSGYPRFFIPLIVQNVSHAVNSPLPFDMMIIYNSSLPSANKSTLSTTKNVYSWHLVMLQNIVVPLSSVVQENY